MMLRKIYLSWTDWTSSQLTIYATKEANARESSSMLGLWHVLQQADRKQTDNSDTVPTTDNKLLQSLRHL